MRSTSARRSRQSGSIMVIMCLVTPFLLIPLVGLAIDASVARLVQLKLQAAVDGAALGAGRLLGTSADSNFYVNLATQFLETNFRTDGSAGTWGAYGLTAVPNVDIVYTPGITKRIDVTARAMVPLLFMRKFQLTSVLVAATASATRSDSRIVLVFDRSGSMKTDDGSGKGTTVMQDAVANAKSFVANFIEGSDEVGLVVFSGGAIVAYPSYAPGTWTPANAVNKLGVSATGGPDSSFSSGSATDIPHMLDAMTAESFTNTSEALTMAYTELQKAHMRDYASGSDDRTNAIVLLTDGIPTSLSLLANNPDDNALKTTPTPSPCTYNPYTSKTDPAKIKLAGDAAAAHPMYGWIQGPGIVPPYSTTGSSITGLCMIPSRDPAAAHTPLWWMSNAKTGGEANPDTAANYVGCTGLQNSTNLSKSTTDLGRIPSYDMYGNALNPAGQPYHNSHLTGHPSGVTTIYTGTEMDQTKSTIDYHWALAGWNAVDSAGQSIHTDANYANRTGDSVDKMNITVYVIAYLGNNGADDGLLRRVANDPSAAGYDKTLPTGMYVPATDKDALAAAFNKVATALLRLAK